MNFPRVVIAGTGSGVGKTIISLGIMHLIKKRGYRVSPFKVGPDYIDPGHHRSVTSVPSRNLDSFLMDENTIIEIFSRSAGDISIIEGVRGLFEGISVDSDAGSTAHIAKILKSPVILVLNVRSITKSAAAIVSGFRNFDRKVEIRGVILNNVSGEGHRSKVVRAIKKFSDIEVLGVIPRTDLMEMKNRHLGLIPAVESAPDPKRIGEIVEKNVDLDRIIKIANSAEDLPPGEERIFKEEKKNERLKVGIAYDRAFNFYYEDSFDLLRLNGCDLLFFSPLNDKEPPEEIHGLYIGGGYPEVFAEELSKNRRMLREIKRLADDEIPIYAECGGLLYLSNSIEDERMVGFLPCRAEMSDRNVNFTINEIVRDTIIGKKGKILRGHEFHYSRIVEISRDVDFAYRMRRGKGIEKGYDGIVLKKTLASYTHLHFASDPEIVRNLVNSFEDYAKS
ncbi:MAG: Ni-sirohydrochlorin a,c-diamide synthase [Candidatus Syntropharchaeia archaeon]